MGLVPDLVVLVGPIAAGKNTVAAHLERLLADAGRTVVVADVDDVAAMVGAPGAAHAGLWFAAHEAHGALVGQWMRAPVDVVIVVGPIYSKDEQAAFTRHLPDPSVARWVLIDAPVAVTFARAQADPSRGLSKDPEFHHSAHQRFRELVPGIPADMVFDSSATGAKSIASEIASVIKP